jgi:ABC-type glycerol-3-phosphate transport system substrate-binding protein
MSLVCLLLLSAIVIFAGGQQEKTGGKVTLRIAHSLGEGDNTAGPYFVPMLKKWAAEHAGQVELLEETTARSDDMATKLYVQLAGGDLPDVMYLVGGGARLGPLVQGNVLLDINNYLKETKALKREDIYEGAWNLYTIDGVLYGVPTSRYVMGWLVNSDIFKKYGLAYPQTYEEMVKQAGVFKNNGLVPLADGSIQGNPSHFLFSEVQAQFKGGLEEINSIAQTKKFNTAVTLKTAQLFEQMRKNGLFPQDTMANGGWGPSYTLYNESKAAMCYTAT